MEDGVGRERGIGGSFGAVVGYSFTGVGIDGSESGSDRLYTDERGGVEGARDSSSSSEEGMFNERISSDMEIVVELRADPASRMVPTVDWD